MKNLRSLSGKAHHKNVKKWKKISGTEKKTREMYTRDISKKVRSKILSI